MSNQNILYANYRHCSVCQKGVFGTDVKICSKCKRRAYCSRECQRIDWVRKGTEDGIQGQGHKNWCDLLCGEQDIDWKIVPINGKGLGVVAMRLIPANYRIVVERTRVKNIAGRGAVQTLSMGEKFNHSCDPNSCRAYDPEFETHIIHNRREIKEGDEITVSYISYKENFVPIPNLFGVLRGKTTLDTFQDVREVLKGHFKINCSASCPCRNNEKEMDALLKEGREKYASLRIANRDEQRHYSNEDAVRDFCIIEDLLELDRRTDPDAAITGSTRRASILEKGFEVCLHIQDSLPQALRFMKEAYEIWSSAPMHPESEKCKSMKADLDDPEQAKKRFESASNEPTKMDQMMSKKLIKFLKGMGMVSNVNK